MQQSEAGRDITEGPLLGEINKGLGAAWPQKGQRTAVLCTELQVGLEHPVLPTLAPDCWWGWGPSRVTS